MLSALAALILKVEKLLCDKDDLKRDMAAIFSVIAALLITISTSGDFQRKWQANRIAASELERLGYDFLDDKEDSKTSYYSTIGAIQHKKNLAIAGQASE